MNDIKWIIFIGAIILLTLLIYRAYWLNDNLNKPIPPDARCENCNTKTTDNWHEVRCRNKRSEFNGLMMDDYACCDAWKGIRK